MKSEAGAPSWRRLGLGVSLPLAVWWSLPRGYGLSIEAFPLMVGLLATGVIGSLGLGRVRRAALAWLALLVGTLMLRGATIPLYNLMLLPVGVAFWVGLALGEASGRDARVARAVVAGLAMGLAVNFAAAVLQYLHLESFFAPWVTPGGWGGSARPYGNLRQSNHLGMFFALGLALLWGLAAGRVLSRAATATLVALACLVIALSGSRIAVLSAGAVAAMALVWRRSAPAGVSAPFLAAPLLVLLFSAGASLSSALWGTDRISVVERGMDSISLRLFHWRATLEMIAAEPWSGVGWREYRHARFLLHPEHAAVEIAEHAHNLFLHLAAEVGLPLMLLVTLPVLVFALRRRPWREHDPRQQAAWLVLLLLFLYSQVEFPLWEMHFLFLAAVAAGSVLGASTAAPPRRPPWAFPRLAGWALLLATAMALLDYDRASAILDEGTLLDWGATPQQRAAAAQETVLFGTHVERVLLGAVVLGDANHRQVLAYTEELMHFGPEPAVLEPRLLAACLGGDLATTHRTAQAYRRAFPAAFARFLGGLPADLVARCRLQGDGASPGRAGDD